MASMGEFSIDFLLAVCGDRIPALQTLSLTGLNNKPVGSNHVSVQQRPQHNSQESVLVDTVTLTCKEQYFVLDI